MSALEKLEQWYYSHCDGDWEHSQGITIATLDNPGWSVDINLQETELGDRAFVQIEIERGENDWLHCFIRDGKFKIRCGPRNLEEGLEVFLRWTES